MRALRALRALHSIKQWVCSNCCYSGPVSKCNALHHLVCSLKIAGFPFPAGLWLNIPDYDAPTQLVKPKERNERYVDTVLTIPKVLDQLAGRADADMLVLLHHSTKGMFCLIAHALSSWCSSWCFDLCIEVQPAALDLCVAQLMQRTKLM